ncbi:hypothetical protein FPZ49_15630 [Paenibacillus cremeus]|uniref:MFS transporter n=2 Tax=Paenibacillus cremeus TaxID=2163881 RepID=A0A559K9Z9_9BACL|nr:hypothetical protein FPZ49_15630 [Paenibacillus cremeus]
MSAHLLVGGALQPAGSLIGGAVSSLYGIPLLFAAAGAIPMLTGAIAFFSPALRDIDGELS